MTLPESPVSIIAETLLSNEGAAVSVLAPKIAHALREGGWHLVSTPAKVALPPRQPWLTGTRTVMFVDGEPVHVDREVDRHFAAVHGEKVAEWLERDAREELVRAVMERLLV